jgi:hypothetical protein
MDLLVLALGRVDRSTAGGLVELGTGGGPLPLLVVRECDGVTGGEGTEFTGGVTDRTERSDPFLINLVNLPDFDDLGGFSGVVGLSSCFDSPSVGVPIRYEV